MQEEFKDRLRSILGTRSQAWLANRTGVERSTVSRLLSGAQQPSADTVHLFAVALELSAEELVRGTEAAARLEARAAFVQRKDFDDVLARFVAEEGRRRDSDARAHGLKEELGREREISRGLRAEADNTRSQVAALSQENHALAADLRGATEETGAARAELEARNQELVRAVGEIATLNAQVRELSGAVDRTKVTAGVAAILAGAAASAGVASYFATTNGQKRRKKSQGNSAARAQKGGTHGPKRK